MDTPEEKFETALDGSNEADERERAIDELETANECDRLAELASTDDLDREYRELALDGLAHPQCRTMLEDLVDGGDLPEPLQGKAEDLLRETQDGAGAGP